MAGRRETMSKKSVAKHCEWGGLAGPVAKVVVPYEEFVKRKKTLIRPMGIEIDRDKLNPRLFDWQADIVHWALRRGRAAIFASCGLGKTLVQLEWANQIWKHTQAPVVIHCPIGIRQQTKLEAAKFKVKAPIAIVDDQSDLIDGLNLINYEKCHKFDFSQCSGVVLDESSCLKAINGQTRQLLTDIWSHARYRLPCTATPAPNDHMELGNHAEFLGVCNSIDMLSKYFVHDSGDTSKWRLRKHAVKEFWRWVSSWAVCISKPSDIGGSDEGFDLPELKIHRHYVDVPDREPPKRTFFHTTSMSATNIHTERKMTNRARCEKAADIARKVKDYCIIWCDTNYEADLLKSLLPEAVEIRGQESDRAKEEKLSGYSNGDYKILISKPSIAGFGMNWQHCNQMVFAGLSFSFERLYQAIRRCYRFGQERPVHVHVILADTDTAVSSAIARKAADFDLMQAGMAEAMREGTMEEFGRDVLRTAYTKTGRIELPEWLQ